MSTIGSDTPSTSRDLAIVDEQNALVFHRDKRKVLEEDEYLGRMAHIIKRDFFSGPEFYNNESGIAPSLHESVRSSASHLETPGTDRTEISTTSSLISRKEACSTRLNEFLDKYTSEDNAYFEKLQAKERKRHKLRFPWLYKNRERDRRIEDHHSNIGPLSVTYDESRTSRCSIDSSPRVLAALTDKDRPHVSTVNYESSKYMREPIFKEPQPVGLAHERPRRSINRFTDKIDIDGNLLNGSETPSMNGFSYIPPPESPRLLPEAPRIKQEPDRYYLPNESPRDLLAHRLYETRVAKNIRTPKSSTRSDSTKTPKDKLDKVF